MTTAPDNPPAPRVRNAAAAPAGRWRKGRLVLAALLTLLALDLAQPPARQASAAVLLGAIHLYQATASRWMPALGVHCRFEPTCSHYAEGAIREDGALVGSGRAVWRILRCGPWTPQGTIDPP